MPTLLRLSLTSMALAAALLCGLRAAGDQASRTRVLEATISELSPARHAQARARIHIEADPAAAREAAALELVEEVLQGQSGAERRRCLKRAQSLAAEAMAQRPVSWRAAMALGAATYLQRSLDRDPRLFTRPAEWEAPLDLASRLAPSREGPARFQAMAYLEVWPLLSPDKKSQTRQLLQRSFADRVAFDRLIEPWLERADDLETALALVPREPFAWERLRQIFAHRQDWAAYCRATEGWHEVLLRDLLRRIEQAEHLRRHGDAKGARARILDAIRQMPVDGLYAQPLIRALGTLPPGPVDNASAELLGEWLEWTLDLCQLGRCPLPPAVIGRLAGARRRELKPPVAAMAALLADDLPQAELYERRASSTLQPSWAPYFVLKAGALLHRGDRAAAAAALDAVSTAARSSPSYWRTRRSLAEALDDEDGAKAAAEHLAALSSANWPAGGWKEERGASRRQLFPRHAAAALGIELLDVAPPGAVVAIRWDGTTVGTFAVAPSQRALSVAVPIEPTPHQLEVQTLTGHRVVAGSIELIDRRAGASG